MNWISVRLAAAIMLLSIAGCATTSPDEQWDREWRRSIDTENWALCERAYRQVGRGTLHVGHSSAHKYVTPIDLKMDLGNNRCKVLLRNHWVNY